MLIINGTTEKIQLTTSAAGGSGGVDVIVSYAERVESTGAVINRTAVVAGISTATTTDILGSPSSGSVRNAKLVTVRNKDTVTANAVTLKWTTSTGPVTAEAVKATLLVGEHMVVNDQGTVLVIDAQGNVKATPGTGRLLRVSVLSAGTTFTTGLDSSMIRVKGVGGGGGGAGCTSVAAAASAGGGGGAGAYFEKTAAVTPGTALTYAIGAGGTGTSASAGGNGGSTTITINGTIITAPGGTGAPLATALTTLSAYAGGAGGAIATNGDLNEAGEQGNPGLTLVIATPIVSSGRGGTSVLGGGAAGLVAVGAGSSAAALSFGSGGSGGATGASAARAGGAGAGGAIIIEEYS